jgi:sulfur relay protein TusB/DsrH
MPKTAFLVLKSPQELDPTHMVGRFTDKADASMILVEDGVYQALVSPAAEKLKFAANEVLVSREDIEARGFSQSDLKIGRAVDYPEIVDWIMERTERTITI